MYGLIKNRSKRTGNGNHYLIIDTVSRVLTPSVQDIVCGRKQAFITYCLRIMSNLVQFLGYILCIGILTGLILNKIVRPIYFSRSLWFCTQSL